MTTNHNRALNKAGSEKTLSSLILFDFLIDSTHVVKAIRLAIFWRLLPPLHVCSEKHVQKSNLFFMKIR